MKVLIVGAGIAGEGLALTLGRRGHEVTVVEIAAGVRSGGQTIDLRGGSRQVLADWGLLDACLQRLVPQRGMAWVDADGRDRAQMPVTAFGGQGFVSTEELRRTDLAQILHAAVDPAVRYLFGDTVTGLESLPDAVRVQFEQAPTEMFDLVVGADGTHSRVRALTFGPEDQFRKPLGLAHAWFTLTETPTTPKIDGWFKVHNAPGSLVVDARPGCPGQQEIGLSWPAAQLPDRRDPSGRLAHLRAAFHAVGWRATELIDAAGDAPDLAMDTFDQINLPTWHRGRVVLLGDSAWCASPLSGMGTALALHGAASLDRALEAHGMQPSSAARIPNRHAPPHSHSTKNVPRTGQLLRPPNQTRDHRHDDHRPPRPNADPGRPTHPRRRPDLQLTPSPPPTPALLSTGDPS